MKTSEQTSGENTSKAAANNTSSRSTHAFNTVSRAVIQPALTINQPGDIYEQEADRVAEHVMSMKSSTIQTKPFHVSPLQRKDDYPLPGQKSAIQREETGEQEEESDEDLQTYVGNLSSGGMALPQDVRSFYEAGMGHDFSNVRVHTDAAAAQSAQSIHALAYTTGNNIVFNQGRYAPEDDAGKRLLAHELTHVVQQGSAIQTKQISRDADSSNLEEEELSSLKGNAGHNASVFRKGIADFRKANAKGDVFAKQAILQKAENGKVNLRDNSKTLRRCTGGSPTTTTASALAFSSGSFNVPSNGAITTTINTSNVNIESAQFSPTGSVNVAGGSDTEAADWEAGFIQTLHSSNRQGHYKGSPAQTLRTTTVTTPARDALVATGEPWYDPNNSNGPGRVAFSKTNSSASVKLWDKPGTPTPWNTPDGKGKLDKTTGKDVFTSWMIARKASSPNTIQYINWVSWEFDCSVDFDYATSGAHTVKTVNGATKSTGSGAGQGSGTPTLSGTTPNVSASSTWS